MATLHISEQEAIDDFSAVLAKLRAGSDIIIENGSEPIALLTVPDPSAPGVDPEYDAMFIAKVDEALEDTREGIDSETVEAYFAKRRSEVMLKTSGIAG